MEYASPSAAARAAASRPAAGRAQPDGESRENRRSVTASGRRMGVDRDGEERCLTSGVGGAAEAERAERGAAGEAGARGVAHERRVVRRIGGADRGARAEQPVIARGGAASRLARVVGDEDAVEVERPL